MEVLTRMDKILKRQIDYMKVKEEKLLNKPENQLIKTKLTPMLNRIEDQIPDKLKSTLDLAFYKGFELVFEKGNKYIEMTYSKDNIQLKYDLNNYAVERRLSKKHIKNVDKLANKSNMVNTTISVAEGTILGLLGIGLPDIPLFISVIMKTVYEIALSYGFDYESEQEKRYILLLICAAMSKDVKQKEFNKQLNLLEEKMDNMKETESITLKEQIKITSDILSYNLLTAKFVQGIPIIGAVGGLVNYTIVNKIRKFASMKYKMRYLIQKTKK